jgi:hypothetical protein
MDRRLGAGNTGRREIPAMGGITGDFIDAKAQYVVQQIEVVPRPKPAIANANNYGLIAVAGRCFNGVDNSAFASVGQQHINRMR